MGGFFLAPPLLLFFKKEFLESEVCRLVPEFFWRKELEASTSVFKDTVRVDYWQRENSGSGLRGTRPVQPIDSKL